LLPHFVLAQGGLLCVLDVGLNLELMAARFARRKSETGATHDTSVHRSWHDCHGAGSRKQQGKAPFVDKRIHFDENPIRQRKLSKEFHQERHCDRNLLPETWQ
jgi:hypothetical protein